MRWHSSLNRDAAGPRGAAADGASSPLVRDFRVYGVFVACFALYLVSMPATVVLEDDSIFILSGYFNGVSHPPGYPLFTLILNGFTKIPLAEIPARAHAGSAFFAALACVLLYRICDSFRLDRNLAALLAIVFACSSSFWSQALIADVYSLNVFLNLGLLLVALKIHFEFFRDPRPDSIRVGNFVWFSLLLGLALANHWPLTVLAMPAYLLLIARPFHYLRGKPLAVFPGIGVVVVLYGYLYFNNQSSPFINFSGEFANAREFIDFLLRAHYEQVDQNESAGWWDKLRFCGDIAVQIVQDLNLLLVFSLLGFARLLADPRERLLGIALLWLVVSNSLLLVLLLNFDYGDLFSYVFRVYTLVALAALYVIGAHELAVRHGDPDRGIGSRRLVLLLGVCLGLNVYFSLPQNYRHDYSWGEEYAQRILSGTPANAVIFADGEIELGLLSYYRYVENYRPDVQLYSASGLLLNNRLFDIRLENKKAFIERYIDDHPDRAFYAANNHYELETVSRTVFLDRLGEPDGETVSTIDSHDIDLILKWSAEPANRDTWTRIAIANLRQQAIAILAPRMRDAAGGELRQYVASKIEELIQSDEDLLHFLLALIRDEDTIDQAYFESFLGRVDRASLGSKQADSHYVYLAERIGQPAQTAAIVDRARERACRNWQSVKNIYCIAP